MAERLKNTLAFDLAPGASAVLIHGLETSRPRPLAPDIIFLPSPDLVVDASTIESVTLRNNGGVAQSGVILVEAWHTIERAFEDVNDENLPVKPYVVVSVEGNGAPPIPPFPVPNLYPTIFANQTGSDETGIGTEAKPYRTFQRAVRDVPYLVMPGYHYLVNVTGLGEETLPDGYSLPSWISGNGNGNGFAVEITADHELALGPVDSVLNAGLMNEDPDTGMFSVNDPSKAFTPGALKGLFVRATSSENPDETGIAGVIHDNTATEIFITSNEGADWAFPFSIMKCSATLRGNGAGAFSGMINGCFIHSLAVNGIAIIPLDPEDTGWCQQGGHVWFTGCHLERPRVNSGVRFHGLETCNIVNSTIDGEMYVKSSRLSGEFTSWGRSANQGLSIFRGSCLDGCSTIICFDTSSVDGFFFGGVMNLSNVLIKNSIGDAIVWPGGNASLKNVKIENAVAGPFSPGNGVVFGGGILARLEHVTGTGNAGVGVVAYNGAQVEILPDTTLTGLAGTLQVGKNAVLLAYPIAPYNEADPLTFTRAFDPTF